MYPFAIIDETKTLQLDPFFINSPNFEGYISISDAIQRARPKTVDCYIVNIDTIKKTDLKLLRKIKALSPQSVIIAYSKGESSNYIRDVDDYGVCDFLIEKNLPLALELKLRSIGRRQDPAPQKTRGQLVFFDEALIVLRDKTVVRLGHHEFSILKHLYKVYPEPEARSNLCPELRCGGRPQRDKLVNLYVFHLRRKVKRIDLAIETIRNVGFKLQMEHAN